MLGQEEVMQNIVDTQQAIALEENLAIGHIEKALVSQLLELVSGRRVALRPQRCAGGR